MQSIWVSRQRNIEENKKERQLKIEHNQQLARECGASEKTPKLWIGVLKIIVSEAAMNFFIMTKPKGRMAIIKYYVGVKN